jgi:plastocyanin
MFAGIVVSFAFATAPAWSQQATVSLQVVFTQLAGGKQQAPLSAESPVVVWLTPLDRPVPPVRATQTFRMVQKNKQFVPHMLVVPVGSTIEFPNEDPFFHNVFSLFDGRRFDLGLYQTHQSRSTRFDREGVSYIFCNIHSEMGGIIVSLNTPYFATSATSKVMLQAVPVGSYMLHVWSERATLESTRQAERKVVIHEGENDLGHTMLQIIPEQKLSHKNMFGEDYPRP